MKKAIPVLCSLVLWGLLLTAPSAAQDLSPAEVGRPRQIDSRVEGILREMSDFLAGTQSFALEAEEVFDEVHPRAPRVQLTNVRRAAVVRPGRFAADAAGDTLNRAIWYDDRTLTVLDKKKNLYAVLEMPETIDAVLDNIMEEHGVVVPLSDFFYSNPYEVLMEGVRYGEYLGVHRAAGFPCHHLAFAQEGIEWQIWIEAGERPLPRKLVIAYVDEPGVPQYSATIHRWSLTPRLSEDLFSFQAPEGAEKVDPSLFRGRGSVEATSQEEDAK